MEEKEIELEQWEKDAWEQLRKADEETLKNLKDNEALFDNMVYYTRPKNEVEELMAIVSIDSDTKIINILWTESDEELIEDYIESKIDEIPAGTFFIKFWGFDEKTSYEYDEWDFITSVNYEIEKYSDFNFEKALKQIPRVIESNKILLQKINALQGYLEKQNTAGAYECMHEIKKHLYKEIDEIG